MCLPLSHGVCGCRSLFAHSQRLGMLHCVERVFLESVVVVPRRTRNYRETECIGKRVSFFVC